MGKTKSKMMSALEFKQRYYEGEVTSDECVIWKQVIIDNTKNIRETSDGLLVPFIISTSGIDRDGDTINASGWKLDNYRKNPVVLWAHNYSMPPVARSLTEWVDGDRLKSDALFTPKDLNSFGYMIGQMYKEGFLKAVSVGFRGTKWTFVEGVERPFGIDFEEQELLEYSGVPVPANQDALIEARSMGIDMTPMLDWATKSLDEGVSPIERPYFEGVYKVLSTPKITTIVRTTDEGAELTEEEEARVVQNEQEKRDIMNMSRMMLAVKKKKYKF